MKRFTLRALGATFLLTLATATLSAQNANPPAGGGDAGNRRGGGNFNPEEFRARMEERLKTSLKASDDEWKVLQPLIEKTFEAQRAAGPGRGGFGGGRPPGGPGGGGAPGGSDSTPGTTASGPAGDRNRGGSPEGQALRDALDNDATTPETIKARLTAVREARKKGQADLTTARENLRKVLTVRQEAVLVSMGLLD